MTDKNRKVKSLKESKKKENKTNDIFEEDENFFITGDDNINRIGVDGDYLISLMPKSEKLNKLELIDELYDRFCNISECEAEKGNKSCTFDVQDEYPGYGVYDPKEIAILLYQKIICRPGLTGYAEQINSSLYRLHLTWFPSNQESIQTKSNSNKSSISTKSTKSNITNKSTKSITNNNSINNKNNESSLSIKSKNSVLITPSKKIISNNKPVTELKQSEQSGKSIKSTESLMTNKFNLSNDINKISSKDFLQSLKKK